MARTRQHELGVGILMLAAFGVLAFLSLKVGALGNFGDELRASVELADAAGLTEGAEVKVAGVAVGSVISLRVEHDKAVAELKVRRDVNLRQDVRVQVRARSVLGEKFVELRPQSADAPLLEDGARLTDVVPATEIDQLVNAMGPLVQSLDPEAVDALLRSLNATMKEDPERISRMVRDTETALHNAALASAELPALTAEARATLASVRTVAGQAGPVLRKADHAVGSLDAVAQDLPATLTEVRGLVGDARVAVADGRLVLGDLKDSTGDIKLVLSNLKEIDKWELRRLLREEGIVVRLRESEVVEPAP
jgi:phospholipid/cholesterol/gamma-HCH transport system substrate-binding protein